MNSPPSPPMAPESVAGRRWAIAADGDATSIKVRIKCLTTVFIVSVLLLSDTRSRVDKLLFADRRRYLSEMGTGRADRF